MRLLAEKDRSVAEFIYDKYSPAIYGLILQKIKFKKVAEKILLDTFVSFLKGDFSKYPFPNNIYTILYNITNSYIKKSRVLYVSNSSTDTLYHDYSFKFRRG